MKSRRFALLICAALLLLESPSLIPVVHAQTPGQPRVSKEKARPSAISPKTAAEPSAEVKAVTQAILEEIDKNSELMANIDYLRDMIGPRLTGSSGLTRASHWSRDKFKQYGLANVQLEPWIIHQAWTRGEARGRVIEPTVQRLLLESAGWGPWHRPKAARYRG
jgi:carboxypeptidase Q